MARSRHPNKDIESSLNHAEDVGWRVEKSQGHSWGRLYCPHKDAPCVNGGMWCVTSISSTPKNPSSVAKKIKKMVDKCVVVQVKREDSAEGESDE